MGFRVSKFNAFHNSTMSFVEYMIFGGTSSIEKSGVDNDGMSLLDKDEKVK